MKKQNFIRTSMVLLLFFAFAYVQAGFIPVISTTAACNSSTGGSATITGTGVSGPFYFSISGNGIYEADSNIASSATFTSLPAGTYQLNAYSANGTYAGGIIVVSSVINATINTTEPVCPSGTTGGAVVGATGGATPYSYLWSTGATTQSVSNLAQGLNWVTVTDQNGCATSAYDTVQIVSPVTCSLMHSGPSCGGILIANPSGGTSPYTYLWSNNATTSSVSNLINGNYYNVSVTDANGCQGYSTAYIANSGLAFDTINTVIHEPTCGNNGSITIAMATGTAPFTYVWSNGETTSGITSLMSDSIYYVTVTDANGCTGQNGYYMYGNELTLYHSYVNPDCGTSDGYIQVYSYGGTTPYTYIWSNNNTNNTGFDSILTPGTYYYTVTDAAGCSLSDSVHLIPQSIYTAQITVTPIVCPATTAGSMTVNVSGGGPYTYLWSNGATTQTLTNLTDSSSFSVTATDGSGCQAISSNGYIQVVPAFADSLTSSPCSSTVTALVTGGGNAPFTYLWSSGQTTATITYTLYYSYEVTITDANGCSSSQSFYPYTSGIQLDSVNSQVNPTCGATGGIIARPLNGVAPFTYVWSNGATTDSIGGLSGGSYEVTVTDANGCTGIGYYYLYQNSIGTSPGNNYPACGGTNGGITLYTSGGTPPYNYAWSNSSTNHTNIASGLGTGTYTYTVTDAGGCADTGSDILTAQGNYTVNVISTPTSCNPNTPTGAVNVTVTNGGTAPFVFTWQVYNYNGSAFDTATSAGLGGLPYGTSLWLQSAIDANGCTDSNVIYTNTDTGGVTINYAASCYDDITGYAYTDLNGNCIMDAGEPGNANMMIIATGNGLTYYANTDSNGFYDIQVLPGTYTVTAYTNTGGSCIESSCIASYTPTLSGTGVVSSGNNFGFTSGPAFDLVVHTGYLPSSPGSTKEYWVYYYNQGSAPVNNVVLTFVHDPNLTLISTNPPFSSYDAATYTITWNLGTVPVSQWIVWTQQVTMEFNVPSNLPLGTLLTAYDSITPVVGDCNPSNNVQFLADVVSGSHDPNVKEVSPSGDITDADSVLNYTIRFQNTGNAPATKVVVIDTLSPLVNPASLVVGASNFPYKYTLSGNGIITFTFDPIYLPDSAQSADSSIGFVNYSVNVRSGNPIGTQIKNTASIYFDLNPAVVTNTTVSTISLSTTGIRNITAGDMSITVSPTPVHDKSLFSIEGATGEVLFEINDVAGQKIFEKTTTDPNVVFDSGTFAPGIYIYTARDAKGNTCTGKIVIAH